MGSDRLHEQFPSFFIKNFLKILKNFDVSTKYHQSSILIDSVETMLLKRKFKTADELQRLAQISTSG